MTGRDDDRPVPREPGGDRGGPGGDRGDSAALVAARASGLLAEGEPVLVMLSGGPDSTCLLDVAVALAGAGAVRALHVDHGLRPGSAADAAHCEALCERLGLALEVERLGPAPATGNLHAWAREARRTAAHARPGVIATGHTASDQAETVLYRLAASPGRRALLGMAPREGRVVRPLLEATRAQTRAHCAARGLPVLDDPANADPAFARARVRDGLLPALRAVHPAAETSVVRTARVLREESEVLDALVAEVLGDRTEIEVTRLRALSPALARLVVRRLAEDSLGARVPRAAGRTADVLALGPDAALDVGDGARARTRAGVLRFERTPARSAPASPSSP